MKTRNYSGYLVIDYKKGKVRAIKKISKVLPYEIAVRFSLTLNIPEMQDCQVITGYINIPKVDVDGISFKVN